MVDRFPAAGRGFPAVGRIAEDHSVAARSGEDRPALESSAADRLWSRMVSALQPGGVLVTGKAERPHMGLPLTRIGACLFRKLDGPAAFTD